MTESCGSATGSQLLPYLLRFLGAHMAVGLAVGVAFASLVVLADVAGLKRLLATTSEPAVALFLFYVFNALTFAGLVMGVAVMALPMEGPCDMRDPEAGSGM